MRVISRLMVVLVLVASMAVIGCGQKPAAGPEEGAKGKSVAEQIEEAGFELVDTDEVKKIVGNGVYNKSRGTLIDARPERKYNQSHIPTALLIPDTQFEKYYGTLADHKVAKDDYIVTYCGGVNCIKSLHDANMLRDKGYTNIKIYLDGMPVWKKSGSYDEISFEYAKKLMTKDEAIFIDARPSRKFKQSTIPGSINIPDTHFDKMKDQLPADKNKLLVPFCGGYHCVKSHNVAKDLLKLGYKKVVVYAGGLPEWKKMGGPMDKAAVKKAAGGSGDAAVPTTGEQGVITKDYFRTLIDPASRPDNIHIIDVRSAQEYQSGHLEGSKNVHVNQIYEDNGCEKVKSQLPDSGILVLHCASGGRAGEMYYGLVEDCGIPMERVYFLDAQISFDSGQCTVQ
ncbi:rhodanese-like domain-containing protein [Limisalsivibrio acetivorans]|uniref:rhodanese-like domain-containing protein n=1 Tax=Limisalsivibrio acetivorans TaxID=1304888 RepID=UPI0003B36016|nr:rhodanese-like domain-containing protein [Limisalsivibrio acetivorans]